MEARQKQLWERLALARANEFQTLKSEINRLLRRQFEGGGSAGIREPACHSGRFRRTFYCQLLEAFVVPERIEHRIEAE